MGVLKSLETVAIKAYSVNCMPWKRRNGNSHWQILKGEWASLPGLGQNCHGDSYAAPRSEGLWPQVEEGPSLQLAPLYLALTGALFAELCHLLGVA